MNSTSIIKVIKSSTIGFLIAPLAFNAMADSNLFLGLDVGTRLSGQKEFYDSVEGQNNNDMAASLVFGAKAGMVFGEKHKVSLGYDYRGVSGQGVQNDLMEVGTIYGKYDYIVPISKNAGWTLGTKLGYEMVNNDGYDMKELNGLVYGVQTGLNYKIHNWTLGAEVSYLHHDAELNINYEGNTASFKLGDETLFMTSLEYNF
ncbi:transcriptional regulator [Vibrio cholerae]|uniref:hypothetical protein n=1 Tax=Vibrio cholerae TaxID=666 RepID=UPI00096BB775|nr:hypothetical protein [Vibrio cholerae]EGR2119974.1 transcriptional regulator [Vibrio cholerae]MBO1403551.1 hypothetical protein [Vibrio cholerae]WOQ94822.1 transcriptional regulator [Vibrio cholerae]